MRRGPRPGEPQGVAVGRLRRQPQIRQQVCQGLPGQTFQQGPARTRGHAQHKCGHEGKRGVF